MFVCVLILVLACGDWLEIEVFRTFGVDSSLLHFVETIKTEENIRNVSHSGFQRSLCFSAIQEQCNNGINAINCFG